VGLKLKALSMNPISIPRVKKILRSITREQSEKLLKETLTKTTADEVEKYLRRKTSHLLPTDVRRLHIIDGQGI